MTQKGYDVTPVTSGPDALDELESNNFDIIFLDENMPGMTGLETLAQIKNSIADVPVVMITKSEEEHIMEEAIGSQISDYLIKPVNPNQILLSLKKNLKTKDLVSQKNSMDYQMEFRQIGMRLNDRLDFDEWSDIYTELVNWELKVESAGDKNVKQILNSVNLSIIITKIG